MADASQPGAPKKVGAATVRVWDLPTRLFHWLLVTCVAGSWLSAELGEMEWHLRFGLTVLSLVCFRVIWGVFGSTTARFGDFVRGPFAALGYARDLLRGKPPKHAGHNPLGGLMVIVLLILLLAQAGMGLFGNDDILFEGPLASTVSKDLSDSLTGLHYQNFNLLLGLIGLHIAAALFYWLGRGENLIGAMITGRKSAEEAGGNPEPVLRFRSPLLALAIFLVILAIVWATLGE